MENQETQSHDVSGKNIPSSHEKVCELESLPNEDQRTFVGFFELLLKVDKRVNPYLYKPNDKKL